MGTRPAQWSPLIKRLQEEPLLSNAEFYPYDHQCGMFSRRSAKELAIELSAAITAKWLSAKGYDDVILLGHSMGGPLLRYAYLRSAGVFPELRQKDAWVGHVSRIALFASINRGVDLRRRTWSRFALKVLAILPGQFLFEDLLRGSDFVTDLRIWWIKRFDSPDRQQPTIVQLLGTRDDLVSREDSIDVELFATGHQFDVPNGTHENLIFPDQGTAYSSERYALIRNAILEEIPQSGSPVKDKKDEVIFVVHGIRTSNRTWVEDTANLIKQRRPNAVPIPATYNYFSAMDFLLPPLRKRKIRWFKDAYSLYLSYYPKAKFHFIGHSNGTYLLGQSLAALSGMQFDRVALAGTVLPCDYPWNARYKMEQVKEIRNHRANHDVPVALLCNAMRGIGMRDVGTAGYEGFNLPVPGCSDEVYYYSGDHSAPVQDSDRLQRLVDFIELGPAAPKFSPIVPEDKLFSKVSRWSRGLFYVLLLICALVIYKTSAPLASRFGVHTYEAGIVELLVFLLLLGFGLEII
jgi:alpha-beta hydrolase superfamily lysophospholipase